MSGRWIALGLAGCGSPGFSLTHGSVGSTCDFETDLAVAEASTEAYLDEAVALADGYAPQEACDEDADGAAMGVHYVRLAASLDQDLDLLAPDALLYLPDGDGMRLVGIEYLRPALVDGAFAFEAPADPEAFDDPPSLFCRPFDGPMEGHVPGQPWHYDLHVWLWSDNPDGVFSAYNPAESCGD